MFGSTLVVKIKKTQESTPSILGEHNFTTGASPLSLGWAVTSQKLAKAEKSYFSRGNMVGLCLGFVTESNKPFIRFGVTGTDIIRHNRSYLGRFRERKHRVKNDVEPRVHWTLNTTHQFIIIATSMIS